MACGRQAARDDLGVDWWQIWLCCGEHLAGDLGVAGLVGADEAELVAADEGDQTIEQKEAGDDAEDEKLLRRLGGEALPDAAEPAMGARSFRAPDAADC